MAKINIAIDGPAGAGKSTISKLLAKKIGYIYIDTGAMYRAIGLKMLLNNISIDNEKDVINMLNDTIINIKPMEDGQIILLDGYDVTQRIRENAVSMAASNVSKIPEVRERLVKMQKDLASNKGVVMDGRDIGTCVIPDAELKVFLTASVEERAKRRYLELISKGEDVEFINVLEDIKRRDINDTTRKISPLRMADDAILVDSTNMTIEEVLSSIYNLFLKVVKNEV